MAFVDPCSRTRSVEFDDGRKRSAPPTMAPPLATSTTRFGSTGLSLEIACSKMNHVLVATVGHHVRY